MVGQLANHAASVSHISWHLSYQWLVAILWMNKKFHCYTFVSHTADMSMYFASYALLLTAEIWHKPNFVEKMKDKAEITKHHNCNSSNSSKHILQLMWLSRLYCLVFYGVTRPTKKHRFTHTSAHNSHTNQWWKILVNWNVTGLKHLLKTLNGLRLVNSVTNSIFINVNTILAQQTPHKGGTIQRSAD